MEKRKFFGYLTLKGLFTSPHGSHYTHRRGEVTRTIAADGIPSPHKNAASGDFKRRSEGVSDFVFGVAFSAGKSIFHPVGWGGNSVYVLGGQRSF